MYQKKTNRLDFEEASMQQYDFYIHPQEVDFTKRITISSLGSHILNAAGLAALENGFGVDNMEKDNLTWVVSRLAIEMMEFPLQYEKISIETWVEDFGKIITTRNFKIHCNNKLIGNASSQWALIDIETRKAFSLQNKPELNLFATGIASQIEKPIKVGEINSEVIQEHLIRYSDIDFNNHASSMKYLEWMLDTYSVEQYATKRIKRLDINYLHESVFNQLISIHRIEEENTSLFDTKTADGRSVCKARIMWN